MDTINAQTIIDQCMALAADAPDEARDRVKIQTAERGYALILNDKKHLQAFADKVRKNAKAFGGGLIKEQKTKVKTWPAHILAVVKGLLDDGNYEEAKELAIERLGARVYDQGQGEFFIACPIQESEFSGLAIESGYSSDSRAWSVYAVRDGGNIKRGKTRKEAQELARHAWDNATPYSKSSAIERINAEPCRIVGGDMTIPEPAKVSAPDESEPVAQHEDAAPALADPVESGQAPQNHGQNAPVVGFLTESQQPAPVAEFLSKTKENELSKETAEHRKRYAKGVHFFAKVGQCEGYAWETGGEFFAVAWIGRAAKPWSRHNRSGSIYRFKTRESRLKWINEAFECAARIQEVREQAKEQRAKAKEAGHKLEVGTVLYTSWGYEQTNVDFYQVTALCGSSMVKVRELKQDIVATGDMTGRCVPIPGAFIGEETRHKVNTGGDTITIRGHSASVLPKVASSVPGLTVYEARGFSTYA